jgi:hypothetical protein
LNEVEFRETLARAQGDVLALSLNAKKFLGKGNLRRLNIIAGQLDSFRGDAEKAFKRKGKNNAT